MALNRTTRSHNPVQLGKLMVDIATALATLRRAANTGALQCPQARESIMNQALKAFAVAIVLLPGISTAQTTTYTAPNGIVYVSPTQATFTRLAVSAVPVSSAGAVNVLVAGAITNGCEIQNIGTTPLHFTLAAAMANLQDIMLFPGQSFVCPHPTAAALSVINDSNTAAGQIAGYAF